MIHIDIQIMQKKEEIQQIYDDCIEGMQEYIPLERIYDRTWENKGTLAKKIKEAIETYVDNAKMSVETIKNMHSEAEQRALEAFKKTLDLSVAVNLITKYEADKAEILKREQERKAAEEERKRQEEKETEIKKTEVQRAVKSADDAFIEACNNAEDDISAAFDTEPFEQPHEYVLKIYCSESEKNKICEYINSLKVMYKEV